MTDYLITYDLQSGSPDPHKPFLTAACSEGLLYVWQGVTYVNRLPNTTVWGVFQSADAADQAFTRAVARAGVAISRVVVVEKRATTQISDDGNVFSDHRKIPDPRWVRSTRFETSLLHQINDPFFR
jgi:hypothetical protein